MTQRRRTRIAVVVVAIVAMTMAVPSATRAEPLSASAEPRWAPASKATIHPGVRMSASGSACTANFVFYDSRYVYLGLAASCTYIERPSIVGPMYTPSWGTKVDIEGASRPGTIVYNSWTTFAYNSWTSSGRSLRANDFALVRLDNVDKAKVNPSVPFWGGPTKGGGRSSTGNPVYSYWNSESPSGSTDRSPKYGVDTSAVTIDLPCDRMRPCGEPFRQGTNGGWTHYAQMVLPGGADVGSPVLDARGRAFGILGSWVHDTSNRVTDLSKAIKYMKWKTNLDEVRLATGTTAFVPPAAR